MIKASRVESPRQKIGSFSATDQLCMDEREMYESGTFSFFFLLFPSSFFFILCNADSMRHGDWAWDGFTFFFPQHETRYYKTVCMVCQKKKGDILNHTFLSSNFTLSKDF